VSFWPRPARSSGARHTCAGADRSGAHAWAVGSRFPPARANTAAYLGGWELNAQNLKPSSQVPSVATINGQDLRALIAYLQSRK
jgi:hypothetical protein